MSQIRRRSTADGAEIRVVYNLEWNQPNAVPKSLVEFLKGRRPGEVAGKGREPGGSAAAAVSRHEDIE